MPKTNEGLLFPELSVLPDGEKDTSENTSGVSFSFECFAGENLVDEAADLNLLFNFGLLVFGAFVDSFTPFSVSEATTYSGCFLNCLR